MLEYVGRKNRINASTLDRYRSGWRKFECAVRDSQRIRVPPGLHDTALRNIEADNGSNPVREP
jgi:hypothetical protein